MQAKRPEQTALTQRTSIPFLCYFLLHELSVTRCFKKDAFSGSILFSTSQRVGGFSRYAFQLCYVTLYTVPLFFCKVICKFTALCKSSGLLKETVLLKDI